MDLNPDAFLYCDVVGCDSCHDNITGGYNPKTGLPPGWQKVPFEIGNNEARVADICPACLKRLLMNFLATLETGETRPCQN